VIRISQSLGREARGCRLDAEGLERAVSETEMQLTRGADILIVNKFGKQEAAGRGFRPLIAEALDRGADVLVGVNPLNLRALLDFTDDLAVQLAPDARLISDWVAGGTIHST
jgi:nucleoside-triphosphatase THEP1